ncbi:MAG: sigma-54-dependent Fis family transcriptional regulator [Candidatus Lindowbacteria bacterium]|nr:sigma-54-dependent Fis family transcriptional regulator [Candidatus Lindowbacteria bacterium]
MNNDRLHILILEDVPQDMEILTAMVESLGHISIPARRASEAKKIIAEDPSISVVLSDVRLPDANALELLDDIFSQIQVIFLTAFGEVDEAVEAMRRGAFHYLTKPVKVSELEVLISRAKQMVDTSRELARLKDLHGTASIEQEMVVRSRKMREVSEMARAAAESDATILILGESGTGKEVLARSIHRLSPRSSGPFIAVNCGAIPETLLETDLFGHEMGAFTGAAARRIGKFERAQKGTLFLDEIGTMPIHLQGRLLRAIQEREIERVGGNAPITVDIRVVAATNVDLKKAVAEGKFRDDLYYRLNVIPITIPPLKTRTEDIPALIAHFLAKHHAVERQIDATTLAVLMSYQWPGNIRELENAVERALVMSSGGSIQLKHLPDEVKNANSELRKEYNINSNMYYGVQEEQEFPELEKVKQIHLHSALKRTGWKREETAKLLGVHRNTLREMMKKYSLTDPKQVS